VNAEPRAFVLSREYPPVTVGGTSTVARDVGAGLVAEGWRVTVISTNPHSRRDVEENVGGVTVHRIATGGVVYNSGTGMADQSMRTHRRLFAAAERAAKESGGPDVVVLPDLFCYPEATMFARRQRAPLVNVLLQDFRAITPYDRGAHRVTTGVSADHRHLVELEEKAFRGSDHTVFISHALSGAIRGHYPDGDVRHSVIHLGVDHAEIGSVEADGEPARRRGELLGDGRDRSLLVACGRLVPVKGFSILLHALALLSPGSASPAPHLALVGVGPEEDRLRRLAADLDLTSRVSFLGDIPRREALGWMSAATVAVVPSLWESFCYVCAEMMAFGRPVVATAVDSINELIPTDSFGYRVPVSGPPGRRVLAPGSLASALSAALADPDEARRRGAAARARIAALFTTRRFGREISALSHELRRETARA
jgi:glycogen(starch) synthase